MSDIKWIRIATDIFEDEKIIFIKKMSKGHVLLNIWFEVLCLAGKQNNGGILKMTDDIPYDAEMIATLFREKKSDVELAITTFVKYGMIAVVDGFYTIPNWEKHQNADGMEKIREKNKERQARYREKQKSNVTVTSPTTQQVTSRNAIDKEIDIYTTPSTNVDVVVEEQSDVTSSPANVDKVISAWNDIPHTQNVSCINPGMSRWNNLQLCFHMYGTEYVFRAIEKIRDSQYLQHRGDVRFDNYITPDQLPKVMEGAYDRDYSVKAPIDYDNIDWR